MLLLGIPTLQEAAPESFVVKRGYVVTFPPEIVIVPGAPMEYRPTNPGCVEVLTPKVPPFALSS